MSLTFALEIELAGTEQTTLFALATTDRGAAEQIRRDILERIDQALDDDDSVFLLTHPSNDTGHGLPLAPEDILNLDLIEQPALG